ncbi:serine hydrolase domain-containing protein [Amycolatopsis nigrescens]|uniref:serine hydrolase domain-containing protein n=1 Tax=Amycolatopsis nigrescens TaxID=381445 RepID=UPI00036DE6B9|nr:serine hydrolase domain-containing protein [Amycolatopsis nigrescens]
MAADNPPLTQWSRRATLGLLAAGGVLAASGTAEASSLDRVPRDLLPGGEFDRFLARLAAEDAFSGTVLLAHRGRPVLLRSHGMADKSAGRPNRHDTIFNLASVSKCFAGVAVAQLAEQGAVSFADPIGRYLDGFPAEIANTVTVHQLLTHTSGMGDYSQSPDFTEGLRTWGSAAEVWDGIMAIIRKSPLRFTPGTRNGYSNSGFFLLGAIVAGVSKQSYADYLRRRVFGPAGMAGSDFRTRPQVLADGRIAHPYWTLPSGERADFTTSEYFGFCGGPADGVYSTAADLLRFAGALRDGRLLSRPFVELATSGKVALSSSDSPADPSPNRFYGYGHRVVITGGQHVFGHSGRGAGVATNIDSFPDLDWDAVLLANYDCDLKPLVDLERRLITGK